MSYPRDIIGREIRPGDFVVYYSSVYEVLYSDPQAKRPDNPIRIVLHDKAKTTRPTVKQSGLCALLPKEDVLVWALTK